MRLFIFNRFGYLFSGRLIILSGITDADKLVDLEEFLELIANGTIDVKDVMVYSVRLGDI